MATLDIPPGLKAPETLSDQRFEEVPAAFREAVHAQCGLEDAAELSGLALVRYVIASTHIAVAHPRG